jgi:Glycosyl hydrolases family 28
MNNQSKNLIIRFVLILAVILPFTFNLKAQTASTSQVIAGNSQSSGEVQVYNYPRISPQNENFKVRVNGKDIFVYNTSAEPFAAFSGSGILHIEVETTQSNPTIGISPKKLGIVPKFDGNKISFDLPSGTNVALVIESKPILFIYADKVAENVPSPTDKGVYYFKAGQVYEVGELRLKDNETLYIEGGAVVRGCVRATSAKNIRIGGFGVLDGGYYSKGGNRRTIVFEDCQNSIIEDITIVEPTSWMIVLGVSRDITVRNVKEIGTVSSTDGCDIVGSKKIRIENCIFRNGDDCIAIKSLDLRGHGTATIDFSSDVEDVEITGCTFVAYIGGTALEIGHELRTSSIRNIRFTNCDILGVHGYGGVFGIHNADRATVSDVLYENIRVEHYYNKLIDLKVIKSMWGKDSQRGQLRNVIFRNVDVTQSIYNSGYSMSLIGGYDSTHTAENILFENFRLNGMKVTNADQLELYCKQTTDIKFK